jgi:L-amino acid N-acyltransferase YncA
VVGWTGTSAVSERECYAGVGETSVYVTESARGRGVGKALLFRQVTEADAGGLWTLQTSVFPENRASIALHQAAGYRTLAVRPRIAQLDGVWRDTVLLERRRTED